MIRSLNMLARGRFVERSYQVFDPRSVNPAIRTAGKPRLVRPKITFAAGAGKPGASSMGLALLLDERLSNMFPGITMHAAPAKGLNP
jgi:hypothetical protein